MATETPDEYAARRLREKTPFETATHMPAPTHMPSLHILGTVGEGSNFNTENDPAQTPIVSGTTAAAGSGGSKRVIIVDDDMVARYYLITATPDGDVM